VVDGEPIFTIKNQLPAFFQKLTNLSKVGSPVMLFVLGARLDFSAVKSLLPQLRLGILLRLLGGPLVMIGGAILLREPLGLTTVTMPTLVAISATPVATSSAVMTQEIGGDDQLASQLVVWTTTFSLVTIFCIVYLLRSFGFL
jgi:predicted permease